MNIYVSNLGGKVTSESLRAVFATYGQVLSTILVRDELTGLSKGIAFIEMGKKSEAVVAMERLNGSILDGRAIEVVKTQPGHTSRELA